MNIFEISGWIGAILVLFAYFMVSTGKASGDSQGFQLINISGAVFLVAYTYSCQAYASMIVNIIWAGIGTATFSKFLNFSKLINQGITMMKKRTKTVLVTLLLTVLAVSTPVSATNQENGELFAQESASSDDSATMSYDESDDESTEETSASSDESSQEEIYEED